MEEMLKDMKLGQIRCKKRKLLNLIEKIKIYFKN